MIFHVSVSFNAIIRFVNKLTTISVLPLITNPFPPRLVWVPTTWTLLSQQALGRVLAPCVLLKVPQAAQHGRPLLPSHPAVLRGSDGSHHHGVPPRPQHTRNTQHYGWPHQLPRKNQEWEGTHAHHQGALRAAGDVGQGAAAGSARQAGPAVPLRDHPWEPCLWSQRCNSLCGTTKG